MTGEYNPYTLPTIDFVGGETQDLVFNLFFYKNKRPFSTTGVYAHSDEADGGGFQRRGNHQQRPHRYTGALRDGGLEWQVHLPNPDS